MTAAFAQNDAGSQAPSANKGATTNPAPTPGTMGMSVTGVVPSTKNGMGMVRKVSPDSPSAQLATPTGAQPGTGSGMGKVSGTAAGN